MRVGPGADRAGAHACLLAAVADPAQPASESPPDPDGGDRGPGQERAGGDDQACHQDRAQSLLDEGDERVEQGGRGVGGQPTGRHAVQVDAAEDEQPGGEHQHRRGEAEAGADQRAAAAAGGEHAEGQQQQREYRQHDLQVVDQPVAGLCLDQVLGREQRQRRVDGWDLADEAEAALDQVLLDDVDERTQVQDNLAVLDADRAAALAGERLHQFLVDKGVGLDPGLGEPRARHDLVDLAVNESGGPAGDRRGLRLEQRAESGQPAARQLGGGLVGVTGHVEPGGDLGRDLVGQGILDRRVVDERLHGRHVAASVADLVGRPDGQHRDRRQHAADHDEDRRHQGPPAQPPPTGRTSWLSAQLAWFGLLAGSRACGCRARLAAGIRQGLPPPGFRGSLLHLPLPSRHSTADAPSQSPWLCQDTAHPLWVNPGWLVHRSGRRLGLACRHAHPHQPRA